MTSQDLPESGITTFAYDAAGRLTTKTDARNVVTTHAYDDANRPTSKTYSDTTPSITWTYDANGYTGLKTGMTDQIGAAAWAYDQNNRPTHEWRGITGVTGTFLTSFAYNVKGDMTAMLYPSGRVVAFNYATGGGCCNSRLASVTDTTTTQTIINGLTYNAAGDTLTQTLGSGGGAVTQTMSYNSRLQLTQITANLSGAAVMNFTYDYGHSTTNTGRALKRTDGIQPEHSARYVYDSIYRLSTVTADDTTAPWALGWAFDIWGNRITQTPQGEANGKVGTQTLGYTNNRLTTYSYDAAGNQLSDGLHTYTYDAENKIKTMDGGAATYGYDGSGNRMSKTFAGVTTYYFYGPGGLLTEFSTATGVTAAATTDRTTVHTSDRIGSISLSVSTAGLIVENNRTLPYGESWLAPTASTNDKKFTTYQRDGESGLDYAMARVSGTQLGRFYSPDRAAVIEIAPKTLNRYPYVSNEPINRTDPTGLDPFLDFPSPFSPLGGSLPGAFCPDPWENVLGFVPLCGPALVEGVFYFPPAEPQPDSCDPGMFSGEDRFEQGGVSFSGWDLNYAAMIVYSEAAGSRRGGTDDERDAVASVMRNRLGVPGYPGGIAYTFWDVANAPLQFNVVTGPLNERVKLNKVLGDLYKVLGKEECADLKASVDAVRRLIRGGPKYDYTAFRGGTTGSGTVIGGSRFGYPQTFR